MRRSEKRLAKGFSVTRGGLAWCAMVILFLGMTRDGFKKLGVMRDRYPPPYLCHPERNGRIGGTTPYTGKQTENEMVRHMTRTENNQLAQQAYNTSRHIDVRL